MKRYKLEVAYKGTNYNGFARQLGDVITIQQTLEKAVLELTRQDVKVHGSGRTDAGVHARKQICLVELDTAIPTNNFARAMNSKLPDDIVVRGVEEVDEDFHPRYGVKIKSYRYQILNTNFMDPFVADFVYFYPYPLDVDKMKEALQYIRGTHDFKCFCASKTQVKDTVRTIYKLEIEKLENGVIQLDVSGNGFLYNMVRIMVGTLMEVGRGNIEPERLQCIIESKNRKLAGYTAPAKGLMMYDVQYG